MAILLSSQNFPMENKGLWISGKMCALRLSLLNPGSFNCAACADFMHAPFGRVTMGHVVVRRFSVHAVSLLI